MPAAAVPLAVRAVAAARPALTALTRALAAIEPASAKVAETLVKSASGFKDFLARTLTTEKALAAIGKAMNFVTVADAAARLGVALAGVKGKLVEAATGFGLLGKPGGRQATEAVTTTLPGAVKAPAPAPAVQQVAVAVEGGAGAAIEETGGQAEAAAGKVGFLQEKLAALRGQLSFKEVLATATSFDQLKLSLETLLGSADHAGQAFEMLSEFAGRTPFSVEQATEAFQQLWSAGIQPTEQNLAAFGNVAAAFGKDLSDVTSAVAGVDIGKLDGLEQLGFQVQEQGNKLKISFQGVTTTIGNSSQEVAKYLEGLGNTRFADGMERQANTFAQGFDSVDEAFGRLQGAIGGKGLLPNLESIDVSLAKLIDRARPLADLMGEALGTAMKGAAAAAKLLADHAGLVVPLLAGLAVATGTPSLGDFVKGLGAARSAVVTLGQAVLANPIGLIAGAIAGVVAALVIFKDESVTLGGTTATLGEWMQATWEVTRERLAAVWEWLKGAWATVSDFLVESWDVIKGGIVGAVQKIQSILASFVTGAAEILGGLGRILGAVFGALVDGIKTGINFMIAAISSVPQAVGAAVDAIKEGDFTGVFTRIQKATEANFGKDYVGDLLGDLGDRASRLATTVSDVVRFTAQGVTEDLVGFGKDIMATAGEIAKNRPDKDKKGFPSPPGPRSRGGVDDAVDAVRKSVEEANAAFASLKAAPLEEVEEKYKTFAKEAKEATEAIEQQVKVLEGLDQNQEAVRQGLDELAKAQEALKKKTEAASNILATAKSLLEVKKAAESAAGSLAKLEGASILDVREAYQEFNEDIATTSETIQQAQELFAGLCDQEGEVAEATQALNEATEEMNKRQNAANAILNKFSKESLGAAAALKALREESASPEEAAAKAQAFRAEMEKLRAAIVATEASLGTLARGHDYSEARVKLLQMKDDFEVLSAAGKELGEDLGESAKNATDGMSQHFQGFVAGVTSAFDSALVDLFKGSSEGFEILFDNIGDMFAEMLAKMVSDWIKAQIFQQQVAGATDGGDGLNFAAFKGSFKGTGGAVNSAFLGAGIGAYGSSALGGSSDVGALMGTVGSIIGYYMSQGTIVAGFWGAVIGAVIGALVAAFVSQKPDPKGYATLAVSNGYAVIEAFRTQGKADAVQLQKYAKDVTDAINEIVVLSGGALESLGKITLQTKDNKYYRVIDAAGFTHKFGEDLQAATDYAVIQALKGANLEGLSPEVQAAFRNTMASTVEELASDIEFAAMVRDLDLEPATRDLRDLMKTFDNMAARAQALGISVEKVNDAFSRAFETMKKDILSGLKPFQEAGLTDIEREARHIAEAFHEMTKNANLFNEELDRQKQGRNDQITELQEELARQQRRLEFAQNLPEDVLPPEVVDYYNETGRPLPTWSRPSVEEIQATIDRLLAEIARLQKLNESQTPIDTTEIDAAREAAMERLRQRFEDAAAFAGGENPFVAQLEALHDQFEGLKKSAEAVGVATERVDEAYQKALETLQKQFQEGIQGYLDYGRGLSDLAVRHRDLARYFDEQREAARALDAAQGFAGAGGPNEQLLNEAERAAFQQLVDDFKASLQDLRDAGLTPTEIAVRDMRDRFAQLREDATLLGLSVDELTRLEVQAIERLRGELDAQLDRYLLSDEEQQQRAMDQEFLGYLRDAFALYSYEPGMDEPMEPEPFPGANALELAFADVKTRSEELALAFRELRGEVVPGDAAGDEAPPPGAAGTGPTPGEIVASVLDFLEPLREGRGMDELPAEDQQAIDSAATQVSLLLEQLRLGMTDDVGALQGALGNLVGLLEQSGVEIDGSLLSLVEALASGDIAGFLDDLRNGVLGSTDGFGALIDILLSGGNLSLPDLMHQLAGGTFDAIKAMLGLAELPEDLAKALQRIGQAYEAGQRQQTGRRSVERGSGSDAGREVEQLEREREALLNQLEQFEDLALSPTEREIKKLKEQFAEMRTNAGRLGVSLERVEAAYQLALDDQRQRVLAQLEPFEDLALSPAERELKNLRKQFDELRASAALLGIPLERVDAAYQLALEDRRKQEREALVSQLEPYEDLALSPLERELKNIDKQFAEIRANALRLGISMERVDAAYQLALDQQRDALLDQLQPYEDLALSPAERELKSLNEQFDEMRANAILLGISLERVEAAYQLALQQQQNALIDQLAPYEDLAFSPAERELAQLNEQFDEMRANALLLGVSLERVEAAYQLAIADFWERLLGPLQQFREGLELSELSTLTPAERLAEAQTRFDELSARALGGDLEAAQQLQGAAQQLLQEAQSFYASGEGYQSLYTLVSGTIDQILSTLATGLPPQLPAAASFENLLAGTGWGFQERRAFTSAPFPGDVLYGFDADAGGQFLPGLEPLPLLPGIAADKPAVAVDLAGMSQGHQAVREELRLNRQQEHADAVELQKKVDQQSEELKEVRALLRRLTSNTQYGGRAQ